MERIYRCIITGRFSGQRRPAADIFMIYAQLNDNCFPSDFCSCMFDGLCGDGNAVVIPSIPSPDQRFQWKLFIQIEFAIKTIRRELLHKLGTILRGISFSPGNSSPDLQPIFLSLGDLHNTRPNQIEPH